MKTKILIALSLVLQPFVFSSAAADGSGGISARSVIWVVAV
ncbi:MAG: hypothetical protein ABIP71_06615 [Verrucomicrobiota bacterium]